MDFHHPTWDHNEGASTQVGQDFSPDTPDYCIEYLYDSYSPLTDPTQHTLVIPPHFIRESYQSPYEQITTRLPNFSYSHHFQPSVQDAVLESTLMDGGPPHDIPSTGQLGVHWVHETQPEAFPSLGPPTLASLLTSHYPQSPLEQVISPLDAANGYHSQLEVGALPPSTTFDSTGESAPLHPTPHPTASSASNSRSLAAYTCQCITDGLTCHDEMAGTVGAVRNHLKWVHNVQVSGKDKVTCPWTECHKTMQAGNVPRHIVTCHFHVKVRCAECGVLLSRRDVQYSHANACQARRGGGPGGASSSSSNRFGPFHRRACS